MEKINVGIVGYGNLGKALENIIVSRQEFNLVSVFSNHMEGKTYLGTKLYAYRYPRQLRCR